MLQGILSTAWPGRDTRTEGHEPDLGQVAPWHTCKAVCCAGVRDALREGCEPDQGRRSRTHLEGNLAAHGRRVAEPAGGAAEVGVPALVDGAGGRGPGPLLPQAVEAIRCLCVQAHAVVVPEQALDLHRHPTSQPLLWRPATLSPHADSDPISVAPEEAETAHTIPGHELHPQRP